MDVRSLILVDGTELIAELVAETGQGYRVKRPLRVVAMRGPDGQQHLGFAMWSMVRDPEDDEHIILDNGLISPPARVVAEVASSYIQQVSGIAVPPTSSGQIITG